MALWVHPPRSWWPRHSTARENLRSDKICVNVHIMHSRMRQKSYRESWRAQETHCANSTPKPSLEGCEAVQMSSAAEDQQISSRAEILEKYAWVSSILASMLSTGKIWLKIAPSNIIFFTDRRGGPVLALTLAKHTSTQSLCWP